MVFVPCPGYVLTAGLGRSHYMAELPLRRVGSFWNFPNAFTRPVGERDSVCYIFVHLRMSLFVSQFRPSAIMRQIDPDLVFISRMVGKKIKM